MADVREHIILDIDADDNATPQIERGSKALSAYTKQQEKLQRTMQRFGVDGGSAFQRVTQEENKAAAAATKLEQRIQRLQTLGNGLRFVARFGEAGFAKLRGMVGWIRGALFGLPGLLAGAGGLMAAKTFALDPALELEKQQISLLHWLKGNQAAADQASKWVQRFGAQTPFTTEDIFPAFTRGLGIEDGNIKRAQQLTRIAGDMAALTPGKTMRDAMEALADAKMGEFERLKEFNVKLLKSTAGTWQDIVKTLDKRFAGGADALSKSAGGLISTIQDNVQIALRSLGVGFLDRLKPTLQRVVDWFSDNEKTVEGFFTRFKEWGSAAADGVMRLYNALNAWLSPLLKSEEWGKADFGQKLVLLFDKSLNTLASWIDGPGGKKIEQLMERLLQIAFTAYQKTLLKTLDLFTSALKKGDWGQAFAAAMMGNYLTGGAITGIGGAVIGGLGKSLLARLLPGLAGAGEAGGGAAAAGGAGLLGELAAANSLFGGTGLTAVGTELGAVGVGSSLVGGAVLAAPFVIFGGFVRKWISDWQTSLDEAAAALDAENPLSARMADRMRFTTDRAYRHGLTYSEALAGARKAGYTMHPAVSITHYLNDIDRQKGFTPRAYTPDWKPSPTAKATVNQHITKLAGAAYAPLETLGPPMVEVKGMAPKGAAPTGEAWQQQSLYHQTLQLQAEQGAKGAYTSAATWFEKLGALKPPATGPGGTTNISLPAINVTVNASGPVDGEEIARQLFTGLKTRFDNTPW